MSNVQKAADLLFGETGLRASNFGLTPGFNRSATPEEVAAEIVRSIERIQAGDYEVVAEIGD